MTQQRKIWVDWQRCSVCTLSFTDIASPKQCPTSSTPSMFRSSLSSPDTYVKGTGFSTCWNKPLHNLIIPYYILAFIKVAGAIFKHLDDGQCKFVRVISSGTIVILVSIENYSILCSNGFLSKISMPLPVMLSWH